MERRQGKWDEALADAARSVELDPRNSIYLYDYAFGLMLTRRYDSADAVYRRVLEVDSTDWRGHSGRATVALLRSGDVPLAIKRLKEAQAKIEPSRFASYIVGLAWPALDNSARSRARPAVVSSTIAVLISPRATRRQKTPSLAAMGARCQPESAMGRRFHGSGLRALLRGARVPR